MKHLLTLCSILGLALVASGQPPLGHPSAPQVNPPPEPGQPAPDFTARDIYGQTVKLSDYKGKIVVLEPLLSPRVTGGFNNRTRQQYQSGAMPALQRRCASNGVVWLILDCSGIRRQAPTDRKKAFASDKMTITDWIIDNPFPRSIAMQYRMEANPQMFVVNQEGVLAYTGAIDDSPAAEANASTTTHYLLQAVDELLAGKKVSVPHFAPVPDVVLSAPPVIGQPAPDFEVKDISGNTIKLSDYRGKIVVLEVHNSKCTWNTIYCDSGLIPVLQRQFASNGAVWLNLDTGLDRQSPADAKKDWARYKMTITAWIIDDSTQSLCRRYGARVTPQMFVIDKEGALAYSGAVDGYPLSSFGRPELAYLRNAVSELIEGKKVSVPHVKPVGCQVMYPGLSQMDLSGPIQ